METCSVQARNEKDFSFLDSLKNPTLIDQRKSLIASFSRHFNLNTIGVYDMLDHSRVLTIPFD